MKYEPTTKTTMDAELKKLSFGEVHNKALLVVRICRTKQQLEVADRYIAQAYKAKKISCAEKADLVSEASTKFWQLHQKEKNNV